LLKISATYKLIDVVVLGGAFCGSKRTAFYILIQGAAEKRTIIKIINSNTVFTKL